MKKEGKMQHKRKTDGKFPQQQFDGQYRRKRTQSHWRYKQPLAKIQNEMYSSILFWCKSEYIDDPVIIIDILGFL